MAKSSIPTDRRRTLWIVIRSRDQMVFRPIVIAATRSAPRRGVGPGVARDHNASEHSKHEYDAFHAAQNDARRLTINLLTSIAGDAVRRRDS